LKESDRLGLDKLQPSPTVPTIREKQALLRKTKQGVINKAEEGSCIVVKDTVRNEHLGDMKVDSP
jgi:hypothetical protein